ncbi:Neuronal migration protein doublecortin [Trichoplax sp. H2]|nr:Neuronal migration protein doublecortin [Trichoplax sp. H2]|eukprot:RDD39895.1 Neuronal migration protein doublecortin [Trichoplax sp. H2]
MSREVSFELSLSAYDDDKSSRRGSFRRSTPSDQGDIRLDKLTQLDPILRDLYDDDYSTNSGNDRRRVHRYHTKRYANGSAVISTDHMRSFDRELAELGAGVRPAQSARRKSQYQRISNNNLDVVNDRNRSTSFLTPDPFASGNMIDLNQRVVDLDQTSSLTSAGLQQPSNNSGPSPPQSKDPNSKTIFAKKAKIVKIVRHGPSPQEFINLLLNHRTSNNFHRILYELNSNFELRHDRQTFFRPIDKLFTPNGKKITSVIDLFNEGNIFIAVGEEPFNPTNFTIQFYNGSVLPTTPYNRTSQEMSRKGYRTSDDIARGLYSI